MRLILKATLFLFAILLITNIVFSQVLKGIVLDEDSGLPIPYTSIGIVGKHTGTYGDENGNFKLLVTEYSPKDSIRFSCVGYLNKSFCVSSLLQETIDTITIVVKLKRASYELGEVIVYNKKTKIIKIGNKRSTPTILLGMIDNRERGVVFSNRRSLLIKEVSFRLSTSWGSPPDSAIFRFNIYNLANGLPNENILSQPIYLHLSKEDFNNYATFDISMHNIIIDKDFAATFEFVKQYGGNRVYFTGQLTGEKSIYRNGQQGVWRDDYDDSPLKLKQSLIITAQYYE